LSRGFSLKIWLLVLGSFALGLATKRGIIGLAPAIGLAWLFWLPTLRGWRLGLGLGTLGAAVLAALVILDTLTPDISLGLSRLLPAQLRVRIMEYTLNGPDHLSRLLDVELSPLELYQLILWHQTLLLRSFWGVFGWFSVHLTPALYNGLALATGLCALGFGIWLVQQALATRGASAALARRNVLVGLLCLAAIGTMVVLAEAERLAFFTPAQVPQGRYLFVVIGPIALALALGARTLLPAHRCGGRLPFLVITLSLLLLDTYIYVAYLLPFFQSGVPG
jgi:hypothetical protein